MRTVTGLVLAGVWAGLLSVQVAALLIAVLSLMMSMYAVAVAKASRQDRLAELERQSEVVAAVAKVRDEVDAKLRDADGT